RDDLVTGVQTCALPISVVQLLEKTLIRVGNEEYARENRSFGLTTMRDQHAKVGASKLKFEFRGKSGIEHAVDLHDARLARIVKEIGRASCRERVEMAAG